jgi:hypothetical protein
MQSQIYRIMAERSGKPLRQIIRDTKRVDFYLDAWKAREYGLIDRVLGPEERRDDEEAIVAEEAARPLPEAPSSEVSIHGRSEP